MSLHDLFAILIPGLKQIEFSRDGDDSLTPKVHTVNIKSFFEHCFDGLFHSQSLKSFTVSTLGIYTT